MKLPELRPVEVSTVEQDGETYLRLRDPLGYASGQALLSPLAFLIASGLDGTMDAGELQDAMLEHTGGQVVPAERIAEVVAFLDAEGFLYTPGFAALRERINGEFRSAPARPAALAGQVYASDAATLEREIDAFMHGEGGPGSLPAATSDRRTRCLIIPHIDYDRGGRAYAHGLHRLAQGPAPATVFVFGVAHASPPAPFVMTRQDFDTPFGVVRTDRGRIDRIAAVCDWNPFEDEIVHRDEHSIELPLVMLARVLGTRFNLVPILCGAFDAAAEQPGVERFLAACRAEAAGDDVLVVAGADLAHVGRAFGDAFEVDDSVIERVRSRDETDLVHALAGDPAAWYASVMGDSNARRVCGLQCVYSALRTVEGTMVDGELLHYGYGHDPNGGIVSFAAIAAE